MAADDAHAELRSRMKELVDDRPPVADLLREHAEPLARLRELTRGWQNEADDVLRLDDLALLRFIISHKGNADSAAEAVRKTLDWRQEKAELLACAKSGTPPPMNDEIVKYTVADFLVTSWGVPIIVIRAGKSDTGGLVKYVEHEDLLDWLMYQRERAFVVCDVVTRHTGKLTKAMTVVDLLDQSMFRLSYTFAGIVQQTSKLSEVCYPQLLSKSVMMNMPSFVSLVWKVARCALPEGRPAPAPRTRSHTYSLQQLPHQAHAGEDDGVPRRREEAGHCAVRHAPHPLSSTHLTPSLPPRCPFFCKRFLTEDVPPYIGGTCQETDVGDALQKARERMGASRSSNGLIHTHTHTHTTATAVASPPVRCAADALGDEFSVKLDLSRADEAAEGAREAAAPADEGEAAAPAPADSGEATGAA